MHIFLPQGHNSIGRPLLCLILLQFVFQIGAQMLFLKHLSIHHSPPKSLSTALRGRSDYSIFGSDFHHQLYYLLTLSLYSLHELLANLQIPQAPWTRLTLFLLSGMPSLCPCSFHFPPLYGLFYVSLWTCIIFSPIFDKSEIYYNFFLKFYRNTFDLQCCVSFKYKTKWLSYAYSFFCRFFAHIGYHRLLSRAPHGLVSLKHFLNNPHLYKPSQTKLISLPSFVLPLQLAFTIYVCMYA